MATHTNKPRKPRVLTADQVLPYPLTTKPRHPEQPKTSHSHTVNGATITLSYNKIDELVTPITPPQIIPDEPIVTAFTLCTNAPSGHSIIEYKIGKYSGYVYASHVAAPSDKLHMIGQLLKRMETQYMYVDTLPSKGL
jgi:hypothetical protein